jgi:hypothetical protein
MVQKAMSLGLEMSELRERTEVTFDALGGGSEAGHRTIAMLDELSGHIPQTRTQLGEWTKSLMAMGMTDQGEIREQLKATAAAQTLMGDKGAASYEKLIRKVKTAVETHTALKIATTKQGGIGETGANVGDVAKEMGISTAKLSAQLKAGTVNAAAFGDALHRALVTKGKGPMESLGLSMSTQLEKAKENFGRLFDGVNAGPFLAEMRGLLGIIDLSTPSGKTMKATLTGGLNAVFKAAGQVTREIKHFIQDLIILGLKGYIAVKPVVKIFRESEVAVNALVGALGSVANVMLSLAGPAGQAFQLLGGAAEGAGHGEGGSIAKGLIGGMLGSIPGIKEGAKLIGLAATGGIADAAQIHSPSRVTQEQGMQMGAGMAGGIDASAGLVGAAATRLASSGVRGLSQGGQGPAANNTSNRTIHVGGVHLHVNGPVKDAESLTETAVSLIFERFQLQQGA